MRPHATTSPPAFRQPGVPAQVEVRLVEPVLELLARRRDGDPVPILDPALKLVNGPDVRRVDGAKSEFHGGFKSRRSAQSTASAVEWGTDQEGA